MVSQVEAACCGGMPALGPHPEGQVTCPPAGQPAVNSSVLGEPGRYPMNPGCSSHGLQTLAAAASRLHEGQQVDATGPSTAGAVLLAAAEGHHGLMVMVVHAPHSSICWLQPSKQTQHLTPTHQEALCTGPSPGCVKSTH
jgi:hypothetical protein